MIEPQNTTMPLPAAPAAAEPKQGDGIGFGEMLAQSLGMAVSVDPSVVQQIATEGQQHQQSGNDAADLADDESPQARVADLDRRPAATSRFVSRATDGVVAEVTIPTAIAPPVVDDDPVAELNQQLFGTPEDGVTTVAPVTVDRVTVATDTSQLPEAPAYGPVGPMPVAGPVATDADQVAAAVVRSTESNSSELPVQTADPELPASPTVAPGTDPAADRGVATGGGPARPFDSQQPLSVETPAVGHSGSAETPDGHPQPTPTHMAEGAVAARPSGIDPGLARPEIVDSAGTKPAPLHPSQERTVPTNPNPTADGATVAMPPVTHVTWPTATTPQVDIDPQIPIRVDGPRTVATSVASNSDPVILEPAPAPVPISVAAVDVAPAQATAATEIAAPASSTQYSALAERVMQAVEMQANQPPPRTMVVDIPEIEGLRLVVSVRGGAQVHVVPTTGSATPNSFQPFMNELSGVLADRGFVMTGDGRERGSNPNDQEQQQVPFRLQRPTFRRPTPNDSDLRI